MQWKLFLIALLSGTALGIGTLVPALWPLSLVAAAGIVHLIYASISRSVRLQLLCVAGVVTYGFSFTAIFWHTLPLDWLGVTGLVAPLLIVLVWSTTVGLFGILFGYGLTAAVPLFKYRWYDACTLAALYTVLDTAATFAYSILTYAPGALVGPHFTMGSPAYQLAESAVLLPAAAWGGVYALLFLQAFIGAAAYIVYARGGTWWIRVVFSVFFVGAVVLPQGSAPATLEGSVDHVAAVTLFENPASAEPVADMRTAVREQILSAAPVSTRIFLPEDTRYLQYESLEVLAELGSTYPTLALVTSATTPTPVGLASQLTYFEPGAQYLATSSKQFLMVFGEYMPLVYGAVGRALGQGPLLDTIAAQRSFVRTPAKPIGREQGFTGAVGLCSDAMSPALYRGQVLSGGTYLVNLASHRWFHQSVPLYETAKRVGRVRAVELDRWYVRASNDTPSFVLDNHGRLVAETRWGQSEPVIATVAHRTTQTPYAYVGYGVLALPLVWVLGVFLWHRRRATVHEETRT